jgi:hypothetical protein
MFAIHYIHRFSDSGRFCCAHFLWQKTFAVDSRTTLFTENATRVTGWVCEKIAQYKAQPTLWQNLYYTYSILGKSSSKVSGYFCIFLKLPKVNNRPLSEYSPNLVTLNATRYRQSGIELRWVATSAIEFRIGLRVFLIGPTIQKLIFF